MHQNRRRGARVSARLPGRCNKKIRCPAIVKLWTNRVLLRARGRPRSGSVLWGPGFASSARQRREGPKPLSLSQDFQATGVHGRSDAWRTRIGPPEGASDGHHCRPPISPILDHRIRLRSSISMASEPGLPRPARRRVMAMTGACRSSMRHTLEDGVANAEAPSSQEGSLRVFKFVRRFLASARIGTEGNSPLAPKTDASSVYGLTGH